MDVKERAASILGGKTDIMTRNSLHPRLRKRIEEAASHYPKSQFDQSRGWIKDCQANVAHRDNAQDLDCRSLKPIGDDVG